MLHKVCLRLPHVVLGTVQRVCRTSRFCQFAAVGISASVGMSVYRGLFTQCCFCLLSPSCLDVDSGVQIRRLLQRWSLEVGHSRSLNYSSGCHLGQAIVFTLL